jgi:hypothetical protein
VFVLIERIYPASTNGNGVANIQRASEIMQYLASRGNMAAAKRHADLERICSHIGLSVGDGDRAPAHRAPAPAKPCQDLSSQTDLGGQVSVTQDIPMLHNESPQFDWDEAAAAFFDQQPDEVDQMARNLSFAEGGYVAEDFDFNSFMLTGVVETDWAEFSRQFAPRE